MLALKLCNYADIIRALFRERLLNFCLEIIHIVFLNHCSTECFDSL